MISRRTLFARLSAVALAPLAKVLGGAKAQGCALTKTVTMYDSKGNTAKLIIGTSDATWVARYNPYHYPQMRAAIERAERVLFSKEGA